jgi:hypothetical protein
VVKYPDGDSEDWSVPDMKKHVPTFRCGAIIDGVSEHSAKAASNRRRYGRNNPTEAIAQEMGHLLAAAELSGKVLYSFSYSFLMFINNEHIILYDVHYAFGMMFMLRMVIMCCLVE